MDQKKNSDQKQQFDSQNYQQLINDLHEGFGIVDLKEDFVFVNPAFQEMLGYNSNQLIGANLRDFIPSDDYHNIITESKKRLNGESTNYTIQIQPKNGSLKSINISASPWRNELGEIVGTMALISDLTNQIQANEELRRRYDFEKQIFGISSRFIDTTNFNEKVEKSLEDIGGLCKAEQVLIIKFDNSKKCCKIQFNWEDSVESSPNFIDNYPYENIEWAVNKVATREHFFIKDVNEMPLDAQPFKDDLIRMGVTDFMIFPIYLGLKLYGFLGIQNIASLKKLSSNELILLRNIGEVLCNYFQRKLNEDQIKKLNTQLSEKHKEIEQVLYVTSHDIRSPLVNIIGFTKELNKSIDELNEYLSKEVISDEDKENLSYLIHEDIPEVLKYINAGGIKIDKLLNSLLRLSRLGRTNIELAQVNSKSLIREIIESMEFQIQTSKIDVIVGELPELITDRNLFTQIMTNLIDNAVKYSDENKKSFLKINSRTDTSNIIFTIEDNGVGIPEDRKEKVFEIFNRLNPEKTEGEGIGLTIIKKAVERLKGTIALESDEGKGCKFTITLARN